MKTANYVGLACTGHDNALAIVNSSGELVFAEATERYLQNKRAMCSPPDDLLRIGSLIEEYCEPKADIVIAKTWSESSNKILKSERQYTENISNAQPDAPPERLALYKMYGEFTSLATHNINFAGSNLKLYCFEHPDRNCISKAYDHHLTHAATALYTSPFNEAVCAIIDGAGEGTSTKFFTYHGGNIKTIETPLSSPGSGFNSLGFFYGLILCPMCGFDPVKGEEWKVMGLAAYGKLNPKIYEILKSYLKVDGLQLEFLDSANDAYRELIRYSRKPDQSAREIADLAFTGQYYFAALFTQLLNNLYDYKISQNLVLGGGCALNSLYTGQILKRTSFENVYVFSAPADDGNAVGAALLAYYEDYPDDAPKRYFQTPYLGSRMSAETIKNLAAFSKITNQSVFPNGEICQVTAKLLAQGKIIGWVQDRAEFGPRALGNRSILADPHFPEMKDRINARVKFREEFRPFAPSILHEFGEDYFVDYQESPYMERTLIFKSEVRGRVPAVLHEDGTGRLQTVKREWNEKFYQLIYELYKINGVPIVLNTSLNVMGKPIVHSVEDAIALFYTSGLDALVIDDMLITKD